MAASYVDPHVKGEGTPPEGQMSLLSKNISVRRCLTMLTHGSCNRECVVVKRGDGSEMWETVSLELSSSARKEVILSLLVTVLPAYIPVGGPELTRASPRFPKRASGGSVAQSTLSFTHT